MSQNLGKNFSISFLFQAENNSNNHDIEPPLGFGKTL